MGKKSADAVLRRRILIVDDDEGILEAFRAMLEGDEYEVVVTPNGEELLSLSKNILPDLIILDVLLSGIDGRDICKAFKNDPTTKDIPLIMISAHPNAEESVREVNADDYLKKPFEMDELLQKVAKYL
jgi:DNA-binding response OmpR family regulator